ncbi:extracellular solute-binding protein [Arenimonas sp.]|uniref:extracellular solute-binding protein n=1 Tax=Arenimonas sp. TaxID=1872635 RepID=UPI0039E718D5
MAIACLAACARPDSDKDETADAAPAVYPLEAELGVLLPSAYAGRSAERPRGAWFDEFERSTGCRLNIAGAGSAEEFIAKAQRETIDLVVADGIVGVQLVQGGVVQPLDVRRLPGLSALAPKFADMPWLSQFGARYAVPFQAGAHVLLYDPRVFPQPITGWSVLYDAQNLPDGRTNAGRIQSAVDAASIADAALVLRVRQPSLAIADPFELDERQFAAAVELLQGQRALLHSVRSEGEAGQLADFQQASVVAMAATVRLFDRLRDEGNSVAMTLPAEGSTGWIDAAMLKATARHPNCAYAFMSWSLKPRVQAQLSAAASTMPVVASVCREGRLLDPARCAELGVDALDRVSFSHLPTARCGGRSCVPYSRWLVDSASPSGDSP